MNNPFFLINSGKLFHREDPENEIAFCPMFVLWERILFFISLFLLPILQCEANSKILFKNLNWVVLIHWLTHLLVGNQFIDLKSSSYVMHLVQSLAKTYAFLLNNLYFLFRFFSKIRVPGWTCVIKMWLNKHRIVEHSSKF